jgi:hypothetical protein
MGMAPLIAYRSRWAARSEPWTRGLDILSMKEFRFHIFFKEAYSRSFFFNRKGPEGPRICIKKALDTKLQKRP